MVRLDVRSVLAAGGEPFEQIISTAGRLPEGGTLELTAPFDPVPLYPVMRQRGFSGQAEHRGPAEWVVRFRDTGIAPTTTIAEVMRRAPDSAATLTRHGLDLCCGSAKTLSFAAQAHGIDLDTLLLELQALAPREGEG